MKQRKGRGQDATVYPCRALLRFLGSLPVSKSLSDGFGTGHGGPAIVLCEHVSTSRGLSLLFAVEGGEAVMLSMEAMAETADAHFDRLSTGGQDAMLVPTEGLHPRCHIFRSYATLQSLSFGRHNR